MAQQLSAKVSVEESPPKTRIPQGVDVSTWCCLGISEKGPVGVATLLTGYDDYVRIFGRDIAAGYGSNSVRGFFQHAGEGAKCYFTRVVHYTDVDNPAAVAAVKATLNLATAAAAASAGVAAGTNAAPFEFSPGGTLDFSIDGGGTDTATFDATAAALTAGSSPTYALSNGQTLLVEIDGGSEQTITFLTGEFVSIGAATGAEVAAVINAKISGALADLNSGDPRITSDTKGTGSSVKVNGGTANGALGFSTVQVDGTGDVVDITQVTVAEIKTVVEADVAGVTVTDAAGIPTFTSDTTGPTSSVQVEATSTLDDELGIDNATHSGSSGAAANTLKVDARYYGAYGNGLTILIEDATSGVAAEFNLAVLQDGVVVERHANLSMDDTAARFVETVINDPTDPSAFIAVTDLDVNPSTPSAERPANSPGSTPVPFGPLAGGDDGLSAIADADFVGSDAAKNGLHSFDIPVDSGILSVPDRPTPAVGVAMASYAETTRGGAFFFVADCPAGLTAAQAVTYYGTTAALLELTEHGACYWPRVKVSNPRASVYGSDASIVVPFSGLVAGVYARTAGQRAGGVYDPPAGLAKGTLYITGLETDEVLDEGRRDVLYPKRINPISRDSDTSPYTLDGVRTLSSTGNFPTIAERLGATYIEQTLKKGMAFAKFRNNDEELRDEMDRTSNAFLLMQMRLKAFRTQDPDTAFYVDTGTAINPPSEQFAGRVRQRIGLATQKPAEYVILDFTQDTRALDAEISAAVNG